MSKRDVLAYYYETDEEVTLVGTYVKPKGVTHKRLCFQDVCMMDTEEDIDHLNIMKRDVMCTNKNLSNLNVNVTYIIKGRVSKYTRRDGTSEYGLEQVVLEKFI